MKTKTFGVSGGRSDGDSLIVTWPHSFDEMLGYRDPKTRLYADNYSMSAIDNRLRQAWHAYKRNRKNGTKRDNPHRPLPDTDDSDYSWATPEAVFSRVKYTEGAAVRAWMEEKDRNYILRLAREGRLLELEPHADTEIRPDHQYHDQITQALKEARARQAETELKEKTAAAEREREERKEPRQLYEEATKMDDEVRKRELYRRAIEKFDALIKREPDNANTYFERGQTYEALARLSKYSRPRAYFIHRALADYEECFKRDPFHDGAAKALEELPDIAERCLHERAMLGGAGLFRPADAASSVGSETEREFAGGLEGLDLDSEIDGGGGGGSSDLDRHRFSGGF